MMAIYENLTEISHSPPLHRKIGKAYEIIFKTLNNAVQYYKILMKLMKLLCDSLILIKPKINQAQP